MSELLDFWGRELGGRIQSVSVGTRRVIHPGEFVKVDFSGAIH